MNTILRFAPSPTGKLHIGGFRVLLYNWLYLQYIIQKKEQAKLILRIDDTDLCRNDKESLSNIFYLINLFNIKYDLLLYQTNYTDIAFIYIQKLLEEGKVYRCICCSNCIKNCKEKKLEEGKYVLHIEKNPNLFTFMDQIYDFVKETQIYDLVIARSNKTVMYHFLSVICDIETNVNFIIRGADHISNTWKQIAIYKALKKEIPNFAHIPLLFHEQKKISKRNSIDDVLIDSLLTEGIIKKAIILYLSNIGMKRSQTIFSLEEIIQKFKIKDIKNSNILFEKEKLLSINKKILPLQKNLLNDISIFHMHNKKQEKCSINYLCKDILLRSSSLKELCILLEVFDEDYNITINLKEEIIFLNEEILNLLYFSTCFCENTKEIIEQINILEKNNNLGLLHQQIRLVLVGKSKHLPTKIILSKLSFNKIKQRFENIPLLLNSATFLF